MTALWLALAGAAGGYLGALVASRYVWLNLRLGRISRLLDPRGRKGACLRCRTSFAVVSPHDTPYAPGHAVFPLCGRCWRELGTPQARLPYYSTWVAAHWVPACTALEQLPRELRRRLAALSGAVKAGL